MSQPTPELMRTVETSGLAWGVRSSFRRYVRRVALGTEILDGGAGALEDGRFYFPVDDVGIMNRGGLDAEIAFSGGVRFLGHEGMIDLRLGELELRLTAGRGTLRTGMSDGGRDLVEVKVTAAGTDGALTTLVLASRLAPGAEDLFDDVYAAATPFDDLEIRVTVAR